MLTHPFLSPILLGLIFFTSDKNSSENQVIQNIATTLMDTLSKSLT